MVRLPSTAYGAAIFVPSVSAYRRGTMPGGRRGSTQAQYSASPRPIRPGRMEWPEAAAAASAAISRMKVRQQAAPERSRRLWRLV